MSRFAAPTGAAPKLTPINKPTKPLKTKKLTPDFINIVILKRRFTAPLFKFPRKPRPAPETHFRLNKSVTY
jgi:hypothetical protein